MQLPVFYDGVNPITHDVGYEKQEETVVYCWGTMPVFSHPIADLDSFRMIVSQLYVNGTVRQADLVRAFDIQPLALKRWGKRYRAEGPRAFFQSRKRGSQPRVLTPEVRERPLLAGNKAKFGDLTLKDEIQTDKVQEFIQDKQALQEEIQKQEAQLAELKGQRREQQRKIPFSELPEGERFEQLPHRSKHFIDTIKIIAYRAETAWVYTLREKIQAHHRDDARSLARQIFQTEANLIPDAQAKTLTVEIHGLRSRPEIT